MTEEDRMKRFVKHKIKVLKELGVSLTTESDNRRRKAFGDGFRLYRCR